MKVEFPWLVLSTGITKLDEPSSITYNAAVIIVCMAWSRHILFSGKDAKEPEQSSIEYSLPAYKFVPSISLQHCFRILVRPASDTPHRRCAREELHRALLKKRRALAERIFHANF